jgi:hypothetical protein
MPSYQRRPSGTPERVHGGNVSVNRIPNRIPPRRQWRPAEQPSTRRTVGHLERELLTLRARGQVQHALAEARDKGQRKTVKQLTQALRNIDSALDILSKQTTNNRRSK